MSYLDNTVGKTIANVTETTKYARDFMKEWRTFTATTITFTDGTSTTLMLDESEYDASTLTGVSPFDDDSAVGPCILTGQDGENADDCTTHLHEQVA